MLSRLAIPRIPLAWSFTRAFTTKLPDISPAVTPQAQDALPRAQTLPDTEVVPDVRTEVYPRDMSMKDVKEIAADILPKVNSPFTPPSGHLQRLAPLVLMQFVPNNIFIVVSREPGHTLFKLSAGSVGMKNAAKTSQKSALAILDRLVRELEARQLGQEVRLSFRGINRARGVVVGQLRRMGLNIVEISDSTGIPHNGCRPKKKRTV